MSPETYDLVISILGSVLAGTTLFLLGLFIGWLIWRNDKKKLRDTARARVEGTGPRNQTNDESPAPPPTATRKDARAERSGV